MAISAVIWDVFAPDGHEVATATVPADAVPWLMRRISTFSHSGYDPILEIGEDYLLVQDRGPADIRLVRKYRLVKEPG